MFKGFKFSLVKAVLLGGLLFLGPLLVFADVGSFNDYSSGGSSWDSSDSFGLSWSVSDSSGGDSGSYTDKGVLFFIFILLAISSLNNAFNNLLRSGSSKGASSSAQRIVLTPPNHTEVIAKEIQKIDPLFNAIEFLAWSKQVFISLQMAWANFEWDKVRMLETNELYHQHLLQLQEYKNKGWRNVLERINVNNAHLFAYEQDEQNEYLTVYLNTRMVDYILDESKNIIVKGNANTDCYLQYFYTFVRRKGVKSLNNASAQNIFACPKCGAPAKADGNGVCEYCGFAVMTGEFGWVLADISGLKPSEDYGRGGIIINGKREV